MLRHKLIAFLTVRTTLVETEEVADVSLLTPETHITCVERFMAKKIYGSEIGDPFEATERLLKP